MSTVNALSVVACVLVSAYLIYALLRGEKF
jgi:hypothetical protein